MSKKNVIEINDTRYDFNTGLEFELTDVPTSQAVPKFKSIDGIQAPSAKSPQSPIKPTTKITVIADTPAKTVVVAKNPQAVRQAASHAAAHTPQPTKTLMRHAVKKPSASKQHLSAQSHLPVVHGHSVVIAHKHSAKRVDQQRLQHAKRTAKSHNISRFSLSKASQAPVPPTAQATTVMPLSRPTHQQTVHSTPAQTTADLLQQALQRATSHEQPLYTPRRRFGLSRRITSLGAVVGAVAILVGVVAVQNVTSLRVHMAASKAGFAANLPGYRPSGYSLSNLKSSPGSVAFNFQSRSDQRNYAITEKTSAWDSDTLRDIFVSSAGQQYQTIEAAGRTLFLYGEHNATWVRSGVWYQIQSHGALSQRQLVQLASSM